MIPAALRTRLLTNDRKTAAGKAIDSFPVVKVFAPDGYATWLLTEIDPDDLDHTFGLCDPGLGSPELGYVSLSELGCLPHPVRASLGDRSPFPCAHAAFRIRGRDPHSRTDRRLNLPGIRSPRGIGGRIATQFRFVCPDTVDMDADDKT